MARAVTGCDKRRSRHDNYRLNDVSDDVTSDGDVMLQCCQQR